MTSRLGSLRRFSCFATLLSLLINEIFPVLPLFTKPAVREAADQSSL